MNKPSWNMQRPSKEEVFDDKVRQLMYKRKITYQEAAELITNGQRAISEF
ncbi:hypothetical protein HQ545_00620 [Candidatus Woesearchaeota archaeon]|nr:hypothetical protein [Candidatus Woesearchaeota archaeon]